MKIVGVYSFNDGGQVISARFGSELQEIKDVIAIVDSTRHQNRSDNGKGARTKIFYQSTALIQAFKTAFSARHWHSFKIPCVYSNEFSNRGSQSISSKPTVFRELDFVKNRVGVKAHFANYGSTVYDIAAEMTIFHNSDAIDVGVAIVPVKDFANDMSTGVSYFEQFVWDLEHRGVSNIDIPVLILGIAA